MKDYDNFILPAADLEKGIEFYKETLGLSIKFNFPEIGMIAFKVGEQEPAIILSSNPKTKPTIWFVVDDVKAEYDKLSLKGIKFLSEPFLIKTGWAAEFDDPFGNRLGITDYTNYKGEE